MRLYFLLFFSIIIVRKNAFSQEVKIDGTTVVANKEEPTYSGYQIFIQNPGSQHTYKMQGPLAMVGRNPTV